MCNPQFLEMVYSCLCALRTACACLREGEELAAVLRGYSGIAGNGKVPVVHFIDYGI